MKPDTDEMTGSPSVPRQNWRVVVVGGGGMMGRWVVRIASKFSFVKDLVVADLDAVRAGSICAEVGAPARPEQLDVTDEARLMEVFAGCDVVLNTVGPFMVFGDRIVRAAIAAGCDYVDIDDDWESTLAGLESDGAASRAGVRVVKGMGASPGVNNLLAAAAAAELDEVDELYTGWKLAGTKSDPRDGAGGPSAALAHWLQQSSGTIRTWENGRWAEPEPIARVELDFPEFGRHVVYTCGHPEPVTLPRTLSIRSTALNVMSGPEWIFETLREVAAKHAAGEISLAEAEVELDLARTGHGEMRRDPLPPLWALAVGRVDGRRQSVLARMKGRMPGMMGGATGIPLAVGLQLLAEGRAGEPGVHFPESAFSPDEFFASLAPHMDASRGEVRQVLSITTSSEALT